MSEESPRDLTQTLSSVFGQGNGATILIVEDNEPVRHMAVAVIRMAGYSVLEASTPAEAMHLVDWHLGPIDLLVTDVCLGSMNGPQLANCLRSARPTMEVLFYSGY